MFWEVFGWRNLTNLWHEHLGAKGKLEEHSPEKTDICKGQRGKLTAIEILPSVQKKGRLIWKEGERETLLETTYEERP